MPIEKENGVHVAGPADIILNMATKYSGCNLVSISLVNADIRSKWQANFMQIFPFNYNQLPNEDITDKNTFEKFWRGDPKINFKEFKKRYY